MTQTVLLLSPTGPSSSVLLLVLKEQLPELQAALLASILDLQSYRQGRSSHGGPASPLDWADGLTLVHSCPSPVDQHLLRLLGRSAVSSCYAYGSGGSLNAAQLTSAVLHSGTCQQI